MVNLSVSLLVVVGHSWLIIEHHHSLPPIFDAEKSALHVNHYEASWWYWLWIMTSSWWIVAMVTNDSYLSKMARACSYWLIVVDKDQPIMSTKYYQPKRAHNTLVITNGNDCSWLVVGFNPSGQYACQSAHHPKVIGETCFKPPISNDRSWRLVGVCPVQWCSPQVLIISWGNHLFHRGLTNGYTTRPL